MWWNSKKKPTPNELSKTLAKRAASRVGISKYQFGGNDLFEEIENSILEYHKEMDKLKE